MSLDRKSLGIIISRVLGIFVFVQSLGYFPAIPSMVSDWTITEITTRLVMTTTFLANLALAYILLAHASRVSDFLMLETKEGADSRATEVDSIVSAAFIIIGVYLLVHAIPSLAHDIILSSENVELGPGFKAGITASVIRLLLGLYLVLQRRAITKFLRRIRA